MPSLSSANVSTTLSSRLKGGNVGLSKFSSYPGNPPETIIREGFRCIKSYFGVIMTAYLPNERFIHFRSINITCPFIFGVMWLEKHEPIKQLHFIFRWKIYFHFMGFAQTVDYFYVLFSNPNKILEK